MNLAKTALKSLKATINLDILETHLGRKCHHLNHFLQIHAQMTTSGFINDAFAASRLLTFSTTPSPFIPLNHSLQILLFQIQNPNVFTWNTLMRAYIRRDSPHATLSLYKLMRTRGTFPDNYTYPIVLQACTLRLSLVEGMMVHTHVLKLGFDVDVYVVNTLINLYSVCGGLVDASKVFDGSAVRDSVSWNTILAGYVQVGDVDGSVEIFERMVDKNTIASNSMIALFGGAGRVEDARRLFDGMRRRDVVTWTAMVSCYEQNEMFREALEVFERMNREGVETDEVVMVSVLSACAGLSDAKVGEVVHGLITRSGFETYINLCNALIHMYTSSGNIDGARRLFDDLGDYVDQISQNSMVAGYMKCGSVQEAKEVFDAMPQKDLVSWSTMISGYSQHDMFSEMFSLFHEMKVREVIPDETILVSIIAASTHLFSLSQGNSFHAYIIKNGFFINVFLGTTLIDMYMKFGCVKAAVHIFNALEERGISTWNAIILGLAMNGLAHESLEKFSEMEKLGLLPNEVTFVGVLGACRHVGFVNEGRNFFNSMMYDYKILPNSKHYGCMVDLLARAGLLKEAEELIESMPMSPDVPTWGALLGACKKHGDNEIGERIGRKLIELMPEHDGFHVLLSNIYASKGMWVKVMELRSKMNRERIVKVPGCSSIEYSGIRHDFLAGDTSHPRIKEIEIMLNEMAMKLKAEGYGPDTSDIAFDIEEEEKESSVYRHSEKIAIAFGLISTSPPMPIRIIKNLRICSDCHAAAKIISRVFQREIVIRDRQRFHHFRDGLCSCRDYW